MKISFNNKAQEKIEELLPNYKSIFSKTDPELDEIFHNFTYDEVLNNSELSNRKTILIILASLVSNQSLNQYKEFLSSAINSDITPVEVKELLYQSTPYLGMGKVYDFIEETNYIFDEKGISIPLPGQSTTTSKTRAQEGLKKQYEYFGEEMINQLMEASPSSQKHFNDFLASYCFGDFYTRTGLNDQDRELITFAFIASLGGCENQLRGHTQGNLAVGNTKKDLIDVVTVLLPFNGFPRTLNALFIINEICGDN